MANKTKDTAPAAPSYIDFVPDCELKKEEALETLIINLPDFKKEQMRVQVNKEGLIKVTGEKPVNAAGTKRRRFLKETKKPEDCDINDIRAKFMNGRLHIIMPKKVTPPAAPQAVQQPASTLSAPPQQEVADQKPKGRAPDSDEQKADGKSNGNGKMGASTRYDQVKANEVIKHKSMLQKLQGNKKVILGFGIAAVTMVAIGAFVASKYGSDSISSSSASSLYMEG